MLEAQEYWRTRNTGGPGILEDHEDWRIRNTEGSAILEDKTGGQEILDDKEYCRTGLVGQGILQKEILENQEYWRTMPEATEY